MIEVSAVSYLNTYPFIFGLKNKKIYSKIKLKLKPPSECAKDIIEGNSKIALVPVALLAKFNNLTIISQYCIASNNFVKTVSLLSDFQLNEIEEIILDKDSITSHYLLKILNKFYWKKNILWKLENDNVDYTKKSAYLFIGDKVFEKEKNFKYSYDLAYQWRKNTGLPFVFAVWVALPEIIKDNNGFINDFNDALLFGLNNFHLAAEMCMPNKYMDIQGLKNYWNNNISFTLDNEKNKAMKFFIKKIKENFNLSN